MEAQLGWTLLSRDALRRAETQLRDDIEGVRDEIGFLALHQAYANRFFPGTSVLHTRLRYELFVPWMYENIARRTNAALDPLKLDSDPKVKVLDLWSDFTNADGTIKKDLFKPDDIHLSPAGYAAYAERLKPGLKAMTP